MNISQKQTILNNIESILAFNFDQFITDNNPSGNIDEIKFGDDSVAEFKSKYQKVFTQLKNELERGLQLMLPNQENFNNDFGSVTLDSDITSFNQYLQSFAQTSNASEILKRLIYYQIRQGFWNKSTVKQHSVDAEKLSEAQIALTFAQAALSQNLEKYDQFKAQIDNLIQEFTIISEQTKTDSTGIQELLLEATTNINSIQALSNTANEELIATRTTGAAIKDKLSQIESDLIEYQEDFSKIKLENKTLSESLTQQLNIAQKNLEEATAGNEYIQNQKKLITKLIGMAADGSLGYKFDSRKVDLEKGIKYFWRWAVPVSIIAALTWVFLVFTHHSLTANLGNPWVNLIVNVIKTTPAWILVGFVFTQYGKERNLQEEYAFKSAIAMTLTAYSEMLSADDGGETVAKSSKQEMLLKSIENIYTQPISHHEKQDKSELLSPKQLLESLKSLSEVAKNIKG